MQINHVPCSDIIETRISITPCYLDIQYKQDANGRSSYNVLCRCLVHQTIWSRQMNATDALGPTLAASTFYDLASLRHLIKCKYWLRPQF